MSQYYHNLPRKSFNNFFSLISSSTCKHNNINHNDNTRLASKSTYCIDSVRNSYGKFRLNFSACSNIWNTSDEELTS